MKQERAVSVFWFFICLIFVLVIRLYKIGVINHTKYFELANSQQEYPIQIAKRRANIYDCKMEKLTNCKTRYVALVEPATASNEEKLLKTLTMYSSFTSSQLREKLATGRPFTVELNGYTDYSDGMSVIEAADNSSDCLTHILGSVNSDGNGTDGINKTFNTFLNENGGEITGSISLSAARTQLSGISVSVFSQSYENKAGVVLTIDKEIQQIAQVAAQKYVKKGAIVVCDVESGEIKALVSAPDYDSENVAKYLKSSDGELINRAIVPYNAGSVFKIVVASTALENETDYSQQTYCNGKIEVSGKSISCHKQQGHEMMNLHDAFINSCNPFFIECGLNLGYDKIEAMASRFRIGEKKILTSNIIGSVSTLKKSGSVVNPLFTANTSIGQGDVMITPLDMASIVSTVANGGIYKPMSLVKGIVNSDGTFAPFSTPGEESRVISEQTAQTVREFMVDTCTSGTGTSAMPEKYGAGGKTASAETGWIDKNGKQVIHGWFAGFFPAEKPKYSVVVLVENGRSGSTSASPAFAYIANAVNG